MEEHFSVFFLFCLLVFLIVKNIVHLDKVWVTLAAVTMVTGCAVLQCPLHIFLCGRGRALFWPLLELPSQFVLLGVSCFFFFKHTFNYCGSTLAFLSGSVPQ